MMADRKRVEPLLRTARGQLEGVLRMIDENRYCMDIAHQLMATEAVLNRANREILAAHLKHCVRTASSEQEKDEKIDELVQMLGKLLK